jgi:hypothetical protein
MPLMQDMFLLLNNPFDQADVRSIQIEIDARRGYHEDTLVRATPRYDRLLAGETLVVQTRWLPYRGEEYERAIEVDLPADLKPGQYVVHLGDAPTARRIDTHNRGKYRPRTLDQTLDLIEAMNYAQNRLKVYLFAPRTGSA